MADDQTDFESGSAEARVGAGDAPAGEDGEAPVGVAEPEVPEPSAPEVDEATRERRREALAEIRQFGDPVLKSKASPIREFGPELEAEAERMIGLMHDAMGIGLAATQVGVVRRMLVFQSNADAEPQALVNPEIEWLSDDLVTAEEGCLSLPGVAVDVERPLHARVSAQDIGGDRLLIEAAGLEARVLQHEIDHLDGVLILDRTEREQRRAALRAMRNGESFSPEMLDQPDPATGDTPDEQAGGEPGGPEGAEAEPR